MGVDAVTSVVLQKVEGLVDESPSRNRKIGRRLKRMHKYLKNMRTSLAAAAERSDAEIEKLTGEYLHRLYLMEDSIEMEFLRFTRRSKRFQLLTNHALFTPFKMLGRKLLLKEPPSRTSTLQGSLESVKTPPSLESKDADDDSEGKEEMMDNTSVSPTNEGLDDCRYRMKRIKSSPTISTTLQMPQYVRRNNSFKGLKRSEASMVQERWEQSRLMYSYSYNEEVLSIVGHQLKVRQLRDRLANTDDWIVPLVGEVGSGKTMLARAVYGDRTINKKFKAAAWANIFKESRTTDILLSLLNQVTKSKVQDGTADELLKSKLSQELRGRSYLVVLDGLQTSDQWTSLKDAFPEQNGSKIILTTCDERVVAEPDDQKRQLNMEKLESEEIWTLFLRKVGLKEYREDPDLKNTIIEGCQGLPLNIVLLGSLLSMKEEEKWGETLHILRSHENRQASNILMLSYNDLDEHLKLCLMYMTLFPKELDIPVRRLQRLWLAEGFVEQQQGKFQEDVAQKHFGDLVKRSLIMVSKQRSDGSPRKCRLLGALHDLLLAEAQDSGLFHVHPETADLRSASFSIRRLIEYAGAEPCALEPSQCQLLRSYISFNSQKKDTPAKYIGSLVSKMVGKGVGLLRVLDLEGVYKPSLPENLGELFNLRYLGLRWTFVDKLPKSVGELPYLETLDLKHTGIDKIPTSIWKLRKLQHLNLPEVHLDKDTRSQFSSSLPKLLTLWGLSVCHRSSIENGLNKLNHLRELGISFRFIKPADNTSPSQSTEALVEWISQLTDLRSLRLRSIDDTGCPADLSLKTFSSLKNLSHMKLLGKLQQLPPETHFPPNIKVLTLSLSYLHEDPLPILGKLSCLTVLRLLGNSYLGVKMVGKSGTFKKLEVLKLWVLENLKELEVEDGAMEKLKEANIRRCCELDKFPSRLVQQATFKELILNDMPPAFKESIDKECQFKVTSKDFRTSES